MDGVNGRPGLGAEASVASAKGGAWERAHNLHRKMEELAAEEKQYRPERAPRYVQVQIKEVMILISALVPAYDPFLYETRKPF